MSGPHMYTAEMYCTHYECSGNTFAVVVAFSVQEAEYQIEKELKRSKPQTTFLIRVRPATTEECMKHVQRMGDALQPRSCDILWQVENVERPSTLKEFLHDTRTA